MFQNLKIHHFTVLNTRTKANFAERAIRTLRQRIGRMFKGTRNFNWVDSLQLITSAYNNSFHRIIGTSPLKALCESDKGSLWRYQYLRNDAATKTGEATKYSMPIGGRVKLAYLENVFMRAYDERWTKEIFIIIEREIQQGYEIYKLKDTNNDIIEGSFYPEELQLITKRPEVEEEFDIEKVIKHRTRNRIKEILVKWFGYGEGFNTWIREDTIREFQ